jgi:hypothetical protein
MSKKRKITFDTSTVSPRRVAANFRMAGTASGWSAEAAAEIGGIAALRRQAAVAVDAVKKRWHAIEFAYVLRGEVRE